MAATAKAVELELVSALGFSGDVSSCQAAHPNGEDVIYPLGSTLVIKNVKSGRQWFLHGHSDKITCLAVSADGSRIATGQQTHIGFKAPILLWDFAKAKQDPSTASIKLSDFHKQKVQSLSFSPSGKYLVSLGGMDDNFVVLWNAKTGRQVTFSPAHTENALVVKFYNSREDMFVSAGFHHLCRWSIDAGSEKLDKVEAQLGTLRRVFKCLALDDTDENVYCGSTTGDVFQIALAPRLPNFKSAPKELFRNGIRSLCLVNTKGKPLLILGCGSGELVALDAATLKKTATTMCLGEVTSVAPLRTTPSGAVQKLYVGTDESNMYLVKDVTQLAASTELVASCHYKGIQDVAFLEDCDSLFVTCANDIRVWNATKQQELLRIQVPNVTCNSVALPRSGEMILSAWSDGRVRAFKPVSGQLLFVINDAHPEGVTAVAVTNDCSRIITGGANGAVRFWDMATRKMKASLKEHKSPVTSIAVRSDDEECVSSSDDGSCIQWDMKNNRRSRAIFASTMFKSVLYHPDESQIITCGSDRKLTYWDAVEASPIRVLEGSSEQINALAIDKTGDFFACGGQASQLKLFHYDEGYLAALGEGHSGAINSIKISPDQKQMVSVGSEGAIFVWKYPFASDARGEESKGRW